MPSAPNIAMLGNCITAIIGSTFDLSFAKPEWIEKIRNKAIDMLFDLPPGIDIEADPNDHSPYDATAFTGGLIYQKLIQLVPDRNKGKDDKK